MPEKACNKCKVVKPLDEFHKETRSKSGYRGDCKECAKEYYQDNREKILEYSKQYSQDNREKRREQKKQYYQDNKESMAERDKQYHKANREKRNEYGKEYYQNNKEAIRERANKYKNDKYNNDTAYALRIRISRLILHALHRSNGSKNGESILQYLPYTIEQLKEHLESQFVEGMSWENRTEWHLDHIKPQSLLPYDSMAHPNFQECWALENLQPLWAVDNMSKGNKFEEAIQ